MRKFVSLVVIVVCLVLVSLPASAQLPTDHPLTTVKVGDFLAGLEMAQPGDLTSVMYRGEPIKDLRVTFPELGAVNDFTPQINEGIPGMYSGLMNYVGPIAYKVVGRNEGVVRTFQMKVNFVCGDGEPNCLYRLRRAFEHGLEVVMPVIDPGDGKDKPDTFVFLYLEPTSGTK